MRVDSEKDGARLAMKGDSRVTPVGKVLRNIHFDELPQLLNIIKGDMSLVGPRPERRGDRSGVYERDPGIFISPEGKSRPDRICTGLWKV